MILDDFGLKMIDCVAGQWLSPKQMARRDDGLWGGNSRWIATCRESMKRKIWSLKPWGAPVFIVEFLDVYLRFLSRIFLIWGWNGTRIQNMEQVIQSFFPKTSNVHFCEAWWTFPSWAASFMHVAQETVVFETSTKMTQQKKGWIKQLRRRMYIRADC